MPATRRPRFGSLAFYPRKRAKRETARVRAWAKSKEPKLLGFAGYKVGMAHVMATDNSPTALTKGQTISIPCTIIECPSLKAYSIRFYKNTIYGQKVICDVLAENLNKELARRTIMPKNRKSKVPDSKDYDDVMLAVYSQPGLSGIGKKKPEIFEIGIGGAKKEDKLKYAQELIAKEISVKDVFAEGNQLDIHAISKGKGLQGPVARFGIGLKNHKNEKTRRNPGSLGPWCGQVNIMWKVPHAGQTGYFQRMDHNKWLLKIGAKGEELSPKGGFMHYGFIKNPYIIVKGSVTGPKKRLIRFNQAIRPNKGLPKEAPAIKQVV